MIGGNDNSLGGIDGRDGAVSTVVEELHLEAKQAATGLRHRLDLVVAAHGLNRESLKSAHRDLDRLDRIGALPSIEEFLRRSAQPRADRFHAAAMREIEIGHRWLERAIQRHRLVGRQRLAGTARIAVDELAASLPSPDWLDRTAKWWERRLQVAAVAVAMPELLWEEVEAIPELVADAELDLVVRSPWRYEDQLLAAFESAQRAVRTDGTRLLRTSLHRFEPEPDPIPENGGEERHLPTGLARPAPLDLTAMTP